MADSDLPHIDARIGGSVRRVELIAYVNTRNGPMARVCWREPVGDVVKPITVTLPRALVREIPGVDYTGVPDVGAAPVRGGRVATGHEWRRTG
jgi:hypothetical protein